MIRLENNSFRILLVISLTTTNLIKELVCATSSDIATGSVSSLISALAEISGKIHRKRWTCFCTVFVHIRIDQDEFCKHRYKLRLHILYINLIYD